MCCKFIMLLLCTSLNANDVLSPNVIGMLILNVIVVLTPKC